MISIFFIINFYLSFFSFSNQQIINNPIASKKNFNPIDYIIIFQTHKVKIKNENFIIKEDINKYFINSYIISQSLILCNDESNNNFILVENKYYQINKISEIDIQTTSLIDELDTNTKYLGFFRVVGSSKAQLKNEIVIYGILNNNLIFYYIRNGVKYKANIGIINEQISCKYIRSYINICSFSKSGVIKIHILEIINSSKNNKLVERYSNVIQQMSNYENAILYDTSNSNYKILCAKAIKSKDIKCLAIFLFNVIQNYHYGQIKFYSIYNELQPYFSYQEDNCNLIKFNSEYLLCCGKMDKLSCYRRKMNFNLITQFNINHQGKNSNLTFEKSVDNIKLIYSNQKNTGTIIYEYIIYPPICKNNSISISTQQTGKIKLIDLFERKTNTKYYLSFDKIPKNFASLKINDKILKDGENMLIENKENFLYIIPKGNSELKNYAITFSVFIEETYSKSCQITLTINACYKSCKTCSKSNSNSNVNEHNCIECKENYYPLEIKKSNCFTKEEIAKFHPNSYFDNNKKVFSPCNTNCKQCSGPSSNNCLSCHSNHDNIKYLYNGGCLAQCPKETSPSKNSNGNFICEKYNSKTNHNSDNENKISTENNIELIFDFISSNSSSSIISNSEIIQVISTSDKMSIEEQLKTGVSPVDLGECTNSIKEFYNISKDENLIILNQEKRNSNEQNKSSENNENSINLGKYSQIEVYDLSGRKLNLSVCKTGIKILKYLGDVEKLNINSAKNYADLGVDIFNASSDYFNNICFQYKNDDGKDIVVNDRRKDIYQNVSFCQDGCMYNGMNYDLMIANCICDSSSLEGEKNLTNNDYNNTDVSQFKTLVKSFIANLLDFNIDILYCHNLVFNIPILKRNIGFYFMILMNVLQFCCLIIFLFKRLKPIKNYLIKYKTLANPLKRKGIIKKLVHVNKNINKINKVNLGQIIIIDKNYSNKIKGNKNINKHLSKLESLNKREISSEKIWKNIKKSKYNIKLHNIKSKEKKKFNLDKIYLSNRPFISNEKLRKIGKNIKSLNIYNIKMKQFNAKNKYQDNFIPSEENIKNKSQNCFSKIKLSQKDEDLLEINFTFAVMKDKRSFLRIYWSYLVESQIILGTFFTQNYLDLFIIKLSFLICTFQISFFLNALFYTDEYISNAYHNDGILDFFSSLPKSIYSFIATLITTNLLRMLSNSKSELLQIIRHRNQLKNYIIIVNNKLKKLSCKLLVYFILIFLLGICFLYYVSSFCAVYSHSQKYWFIGCLESFLIDFFVSLTICIFIATMRFIAIRKKIKCLYILVIWISIII